MGQAAYRNTYTIRDSEGDHSVVIAYGGNQADDPLTALAAGNRLRPLIAALTDGEVVRHELTQVVLTNNVVPAGNVDNELQAKFSFYTEDATVSHLSIPAFDRTKLRPNTDEVDLTDADVSALVDELLDQWAIGAGGWSDSRAARLTAVKAAVEAYGRRR